MDPSVFVHPYALCETDEVGAGTRIWAFAHILPGAVIGADCNICDHAFIEGEVRVGNGVTVKNGVQLFDGVVVHDDVFLGPNRIFTNDRNPRAAVKKGVGQRIPTRLETRLHHWRKRHRRLRCDCSSWRVRRSGGRGR